MRSETSDNGVSEEMRGSQTLKLTGEIGNFLTLKLHAVNKHTHVQKHLHDRESLLKGRQIKQTSSQILKTQT